MKNKIIILILTILIWGLVSCRESKLGSFNNPPTAVALGRVDLLKRIVYCKDKCDFWDKENCKRGIAHFDPDDPRYAGNPALRDAEYSDQAKILSGCEATVKNCIALCDYCESIDWDEKKTTPYKSLLGYNSCIYL